MSVIAAVGGLDQLLAGHGCPLNKHLGCCIQLEMHQFCAHVVGRLTTRQTQCHLAGDQSCPSQRIGYFLGINIVNINNIVRFCKIQREHFPEVRIDLIGSQPHQTSSNPTCRALFRCDLKAANERHLAFHGQSDDDAGRGHCGLVIALAQLVAAPPDLEGRS